MTVATRASESLPAAGLGGAALPWRRGDRAARAFPPICLEEVSLRPAQSLSLSQNVISMNHDTEKAKCGIHASVNRGDLNLSKF